MAEDREMEIRLRRAEFFLEPGHMTMFNIHQHLYKLRDGTAVQLSVWSAPSDDDQLPPTFEEAIRQEYQLTQVGDQFGPSWSTHWFRVEVRIPNDKVWAGQEVIFRWESGCEAMVWSSTGVPLQAFSEEDRDEFLLSESVKPGESFTFYIEMAVNGMFGVGGDKNRRASIRTAEIVVVSSEIRKFMDSLRILVDMARHLKTSTRGKQALTAASKAIDTLDLRRVDGTIGCAQSILDDFLAQEGSAGRFKVFALGHCHIDTAWLWRYRETRRKCARSWASQLRLLAKHPSFIFVCSQMQQMDWLRADYPALWEQIKARVQEGRFVPIGGSWVEADGNMPSGESLVRQLMYGQAFIKEHFSMHSSIFWLPDTFGYCPQLPQIMALAGMPYFVTQKLSWSAVNKMPHHTFWWEGLDGTRVLTHFPPADTYTSGASVKDIVKTEAEYKDASVSNEALLVFGHGDGGGGPTDAMLRRLSLVKNFDGLPSIKMEDPVEFFESLRTRDLATWQGELYLELHRGTLTSQAKCKYYNRRCESLMREAEAASALANLLTGDSIFAYPKAEIERLWKIVLLNQFHDVLPGSSIEGVYHDASKLYQEVEYSASRLRELAIRAIFHRSSRKHQAVANSSSIVFFNTTPFERSEIIVVPFDPDPNSPQPGVLAIEGVPAMSMAALPERKELSAESKVTISQQEQTFFMENGMVRVLIDHHGRIVSVYDRINKRESIDGFANSLWIFDDTPNAWDAWDIDAIYKEKGTCLDELASVEIGMRGPLLVSLIRTAQLTPTSKMIQIISLNCVSPVVDFYTSIDWSETHRFLRVYFPVAIRAPCATFETAFGQVSRPTHENTSWDAAKFEVCAHRYADLSEHGYGVALLNDSKYGHSVKGNTIGLSLLRAPKYPDPTCDQSKHIIRYALFPHPGSAEDACVAGEAYKYNCPLRWTSVPRGSYDPAWLDKPFLTFVDPEGPSAKPPLVLDMIKLPEDGSRALIIRAYEPYGARGVAQLVTHPILKLNSTLPCDILEQLKPELCQVSQNSLVSFKPFQIITLKLDIEVVW